MNLTRISLGGIGNFNCYLLNIDNYYILIDTGVTRLRNKLILALEQNKCNKDNLKYIILTNGTMDSIGNAKYISEKYNSKIVVHENDVQMVEKNIFYQRQFEKKSQEFIYKHFIENIGLKMSANIDRFTPDYILKGKIINSFDNAPITIIHTPGFTSGSICIQIEDKLITGNTIINMNKKYLPPFVFTDFKTLINSKNKIKSLSQKMIYPGMGEPFLKELLN